MTSGYLSVNRAIKLPWRCRAAQFLISALANRRLRTASSRSARLSDLVA